MKKIIYILMMLVLALSCEEQHNLRLDSQDPKLLLECFPGINDTTVIILRATTPVTQKDSIPPGISDAVVELKVEGDPRTVRYSPSRTGTVPAGSFFSIGSIAPESAIEVSASAPGLETVLSRTMMPADVEGISAELVRDAKDNSVIISLSIPEDVPYFGLYVVEETTYYSSSRKMMEEKDGNGNMIGVSYGDFVNDTTVNSYVKLPSPLYESDLEWADVMEFRFDGHSMLNPSGGIYFALAGPSDLTSDRKYEGRIYCPRDNETVSYDEDGTLIFRSKHNTRFKFIIYNLSPEMYRFARARYEDENNLLGFIGLAPASFTYSNVRGGFGALGAFTVWESGWYSNPGGVSSFDDEFYGAVI